MTNFMCKIDKVLMKKYQIFTPKKTVKEMLHFIGYRHDKIIESKIADISCGEGAFLVEALRIFIKVCKAKNISSVEISKRCNNQFYGFEIDPLVYRSCINKLNNVMLKEIGKEIQWLNIKCCDGLKESISDIDFVLGNPPYISYLDMATKERIFLKNHFISCTYGKFDYSYAFIEKSIGVLSKKGRACIIAPSNIYKIKSAKKLREFIYPFLENIIDYSKNNPFRGKALTNPSVSVFCKEGTKSFKCQTNKEISVIEKINEIYFEKQQYLFLESENKRFGDYFEIGCSVATLFNEAFIVTDKIIQKENIEKDILKNAISAKYVRYKVDNKIIFPYKFDGEKIVHFDEMTLKERYPNTYNHLLLYKKILLNRDSDKTAKWFEYGRSQAISNMNKKKLLIPAILTNKIQVLELEENDLPFAGYYVVCKNESVYSLDEAKNILSGRKMYNYLKANGVKMNGNSFRYSCQLLKDFKF